MSKSLINNVEAEFKERFGSKPLVVVSPGRINLIGEHTDYNEGFVFPAAIDKCIVAAIGKSKTQQCMAYALDMSENYAFNLDEVRAIPNGNWKNYIVGVVGELQKKGLEIGPFNLVFAGDIPKGAGLSSSAALENSVVFGLNELFGLKLSKHEMISISQKAEHNYVGVRCGIMDQYASMFGQEDTALLLDCRTQESVSYQLDFKEYGILLINSNVTHNLVDAEYNDRRLVCEKIASLLNVDYLRDADEALLKQIEHKLTPEEYQKGLYVIQENSRVLKACKAIENHDLKTLGKLLFEAHHGARFQFKISCPELDFLVEEAQSHPQVIGARMMGGGFGGCTINIVHHDTMQDFIASISDNYYKKFGKHCSVYKVKLSQGTHLIQN
ncbi:MAG TPA: galactokinase [Aquaticitalea sp.]|nr:galactokinase [Aquaticitalea sp.]